MRVSGVKACCATERVVHHNDFLDLEEIVHRGNRLQGRKRTPTRVGYGKQRPGVADPVAVVVKNVLARVDLVPEIVGDSLRNFGRPRVESSGSRWSSSG